MVPSGRPSGITPSPPRFSYLACECTKTITPRQRMWKVLLAPTASMRSQPLPETDAKLRKRSTTARLRCSSFFAFHCVHRCVHLHSANKNSEKITLPKPLFDRFAFLCINTNFRFFQRHNNFTHKVITAKAVLIENANSERKKSTSTKLYANTRQEFNDDWIWNERTPELQSPIVAFFQF
jgi:hypothetical protein